MTDEEAICILQSIKHVGVSMQKMPGDASDHSTMINTAIKMAIEALNNEPKKAEWICTSKSSFPQYEPDEYRCSNCNGVGYLLDKFCKHCGAEMKVINNEI